jgi:transcriptional regulator with XRE-family HTH domain
MHFIPEWAEKRGLTQADLSRSTGADKGLVSRWFSGTLPSERNLLLLADALEAEEPANLFRHPDEDWLARLFRDRPREERERMIRTIETAFPRKKA